MMAIRFPVSTLALAICSPTLVGGALAATTPQAAPAAAADAFTPAERMIVDELVGERISSIQAKIIGRWGLEANIRKLADRKQEFHGWGPATAVAWCAYHCKAAHVPVPAAINEKVVNDIIWQYEHPPERDAGKHRHRCARALGFIGHPKGVPWILDSLRRDGDHASWAALRGVADTRAIPVIRDHLNLANRQDAIPAIRCLANVGEASIPTLEVFLDGNHIALRHEVVEALIKIGRPACLPLLDKIARSEDERLAAKAQARACQIRCRAIDRIYIPPALPPEDEIRLWHLTYVALYEFADAKEEEPASAARAREVLVQLGRKAVGALRSHLPSYAHADTIGGVMWIVTPKVADMLVRIGEPAVPCLIDALCEAESRRVHGREAAARALALITRDAYGEDYQAWREWFLAQRKP